MVLPIQPEDIVASDVDSLDVYRFHLQHLLVSLGDINGTQGTIFGDGVGYEHAPTVRYF